VSEEAELSSEWEKRMTEIMALRIAVVILSLALFWRYGGWIYTRLSWKKIGRVGSLSDVNELIATTVPGGASRVKVTSVTLKNGELKFDVYSNRLAIVSEEQTPDEGQEHILRGSARRTPLTKAWKEFGEATRHFPDN
jgi:hypothetical protein